MIVTSDFESGSGVVQALEQHRYRVLTVGDDFPYNYNRYFCLRVENPGAEPVRLDLEIHPDPALGSRSTFMTNFPSHLWWSRGDDWTRWVPVTHYWPDGVRWRDEHVELSMTLPPRWVMHLASNPPRRYSDLMAWTQRLSDRVPVQTMGHSLEGRPIPLLRLGRPGAPRFLVVGGMHSSEHAGVIAAQAIVDYLLSAMAPARRLRDAFDFAVIPMLNPDGNVHGYCGGTTQRFKHNNSLDFPAAAAGQTPRYHENAVLWQWLCEQYPPQFLLDFHGYMGWKRNSDHPYDGLYLLPVEQGPCREPDRAQRLARIVDRLRFTTPAFSAHWELSGTLGTESLQWALAEKHQTLSVLYEINCGSVGISEQYRRGVQVLEAMAAAILDDEPA